jgi:DNA repair protein RecN (Recombination protein N)
VIEELRIQGLGVIDEAVLELAPGLTVLTGETGAGKTMVVAGLGLLFGGRPDAGQVRTGSPRALVEGRLRVPPGSAALERVEEAGGELDDGVLLVGRSVAAEGRSRAWLAGRSVPAALLGELADDVLAVHGQSDQHRLLRPARQRAALDAYGGAPLLTALASYRATYDELLGVQQELDEVTTHARERAQEADLLRFGLGEVDGVGPEPGEDVALDAESERLAHADALVVAAQVAHRALLGDPESTDLVDVLALLAAARRALEPASVHDPRLAQLLARLAELATVAADVGAELASYADSVEVDPTRLEAVHERRAALRGLTRKYGATVDDVLAWADAARERLAALDDDDGRRTRLADRVRALRATLAAQAAELTAVRTEAAQRFAAAVTSEIADLAMPDAALEVALTSVDDLDGLDVGGRTVAFGPSGVDDISMLLVPHRDAAARPLARGASGGELSRVMLAVEVVLAGADPVPTMVFDEVDAGVGGRAAVEVGRRLARLATTTQVLVVTHLPQVAAFADRHLVVEKSSDGSVTRSGVTPLDDAGRVAELTRMLAGLEGSSTGRAHAEELLATAAGAKRR